MTERPHLVPNVLAVLMLIGAFGGHPYSYFELLRWAVTGAAAVTCFVAFRTGRVESALLFAALAVVFNPFLPLYLARSTWLIVDVVAALLLGVGLLLSLEPKPEAVSHAD